MTIGDSLETLANGKAARPIRLYWTPNTMTCAIAMASPLFGVDLNSLLSLLSYGFIFVFVLFGQRIQFYTILGGIGRSVKRLDSMRDKARNETVDYFIATGKTGKEIAERIDRFLEYVTIMPVSLDPSGIVRKM